MAEHAVQLQSIKFGWNDKVLLDIPVFDVTSAERVFLKGASGSGKSTFLSLVAGVIPPQQGTVHLSGTEIYGLSAHQRDQFRAQHIGFIFQMFNLLPYLSVLENVLLPCQFSRLRANRAAEVGGARSEALRLLRTLGVEGEGIENRKATELSVGQQQRVATARALIGSPELIIADEPTSALDAESRESFLRLLFEECARSGASVLFVSHDPALAPMFDRVVQMDALRGGR